MSDVLTDRLASLLDTFGDPIFLKVGATTAGVQVALRLLFASKLVPAGPWQDEPGFTAHQVVCFPLMIFLTYLGWSTWFVDDAAFDTPEERIFDSHDTGLLMTKVILATQLAWDIPCGFLVPSLADPLMLAHHVGMATMAVMNLLGFWQFYAVFFYGVIEISGIVLSFVDVFHPKHASWCKWLATAPRLSAFNDAMRAVFYLLYMAVRFVYFPAVIFTGIIPDFLAVVSLPTEMRRGVPFGALAFCPFVGILFSGLQLYWGFLLTKQVRKLLTGGAPKKD